MGFFSNIKNAVKDFADDKLGIDDSGGLRGAVDTALPLFDPTRWLNDPLKAVRDNVNTVGGLLGVDHLTDDIVHGAGGLLGESSTVREERQASELRAEQHAAVVTAQSPDLQADVLIGSPEVTQATDAGAGNSAAMMNKFNQKLTKQSTALGGVDSRKGFKI